MSGYIFKTRQIQTFDWVTKELFEKSVERFASRIPPNSIFEVPIRCDYLKCIIRGAIDIIDLDNLIIYEIKCVNDLMDDHHLQLDVYSHLLNYTLDYYEKNDKSITKLIDFIPSVKNHKFLKHIDFLLENRHKFRYMLFNILDNTVIELKIDLMIMKDIIGEIYKYKFGTRNDDVYLIDKARHIMFNYTNSIRKELKLKENLLIEFDRDVYNIDSKYLQLMNEYKKSTINKANKSNNYNKTEDDDDYLIIIFDTETTYIRQLTQLSYMLVDKSHKIISKHDLIVNPEGKYSVKTPKSTFDDNYAKKHGHKIEYVLNEFFKVLLNAKLLVAHNIKFDIDVLKREYSKICNMTAVKILDNIDVYDTMTESKSIIKALNKNGSLKYPSLSEFYTFFCLKQMDPNKAHNALYDIECLYEGFVKLKQFKAKYDKPPVQKKTICDFLDNCKVIR